MPIRLRAQDMEPQVTAPDDDIRFTVTDSIGNAQPTGRENRWDVASIGVVARFGNRRPKNEE